MTVELVKQSQEADQNAAIMERVLLVGDLAKLQPRERVEYYAAICRSVGLNPLTQPLGYLQLNGSLKLYAYKACTDQLRQIHGISIELGPAQIDPEAGTVERLAKAWTPDGRRDEDVGVCPLPKAGEARANALMKAVTKAKRRVTLSICGLSILDESEIDGLRDAHIVKVSPEGEILTSSAAWGDDVQRAHIEERATIEARERVEADKLAEGWTADLQRFEGESDADAFARWCDLNGAEWHSLAARPSGKNAHSRVWTQIKKAAERVTVDPAVVREWLAQGGPEPRSMVPGEERKPVDVYTFRGGKQAGKRIDEVPDDYLRDLSEADHPIHPTVAQAVRDELVRRGMR